MVGAPQIIFITSIKDYMQYNKKGGKVQRIKKKKSLSEGPQKDSVTFARKFHLSVKRKINKLGQYPNFGTFCCC